jgi:transcriptional regulator with XRE-family HTH domain
LPKQQNIVMDDVLRSVGPRLRALRQRRDLTLGDLSATTGISVSTLSRLESGLRRPNLELLLPLARAHQVPIDDRATREWRSTRPRAALHAQRDDIPAVDASAWGLQAYKLLIPASRPAEEREPQEHDGNEWLYVLSGRLRLVLGERDLILAPGEAAEFGTRLPHWFDRAGPASVELLSLFGAQGERMHVRARPRD